VIKNSKKEKKEMDIEQLTVRKKSIPQKRDKFYLKKAG
jgi:hypothetical protein